MIKLNHTYSQLPESFYSLVSPAKFPDVKLLYYNHVLSEHLGLNLDHLSDEELAHYFSGQKLFAGSLPLAQVYAGHQFGHFNPQLGDGRALLLGEVRAKDEHSYDIQLKGSGQTPYSRRGDGRSALGPVIRELIVSEAMHSLNIPTTRGLCAVSTGETVYREEPLLGGVFTRVAKAHLRIGTFEFFASRNRVEDLKRLTDYAILRLYPEVQEAANPYLDFFKLVSLNKLTLVSKWMGVGFIHGVMNTDNTSISGETIDYGPCAFMDRYKSSRFFSSIDRQGRYRYENQGAIACWNLSVLAHCLVPILQEFNPSSIVLLEEELKSLEQKYKELYYQSMGEKLGLVKTTDKEAPIVDAWLEYLEKSQKDFTLTHRKLMKALSGESDHDIPLSLFESIRNKQSIASPQLMAQSNPVRIPRNHQVEKAIAAAYGGDHQHLKVMMEAFKNPFQEDERFSELEAAPQDGGVGYKTFCGT